MRDGLGASCVALPPGNWPTVLDWLVERFPMVARDAWIARMQTGRVVEGDGTPLVPDRPYAKDLRIWYYRELAHEPVVPFEAQLLFRDDWLVVADKPHFLPVIPSGKYVQETLLVRLKRELGIESLVPIHRIDRGTAGLVVFAVQPHTRNAYQRLFEQREVHKTYEAIVHFMRSDEVPGEPNSETGIELLAAEGPWAHLRLTPATGRKHQLRVHCAALGVPIANDTIYPVFWPEGSDDFSRPMQLLARTLAFTDPVTGAERRFESARRLSMPPPGA
ncbi:MAG: pseudouridine synthase [Variovorax paradoxus]|uniref:Pseudouridine synthase n=1 Tax=Variovorax paradoxus TaxID=34073 RepID=A0A2W5PVX1_VARPD|nr:MAG: pseudouridine synthase [Variovorax paradoxus]